MKFICLQLFKVIFAVAGTVVSRHSSRYSRNWVTCFSKKECWVQLFILESPLHLWEVALQMLNDRCSCEWWPMLSSALMSENSWDLSTPKKLSLISIWSNLGLSYTIKWWPCLRSLQSMLSGLNSFQPLVYVSLKANWQNKWQLIWKRRSVWLRLNCRIIVNERTSYWWVKRLQRAIEPHPSSPLQPIESSWLDSFSSQR